MNTKKGLSKKQHKKEKEVYIVSFPNLIKPSVSGRFEWDSHRRGGRGGQNIITLDSHNGLTNKTNDNVPSAMKSP